MSEKDRVILTIIIPTFNSAFYIYDILKGIVEQKFLFLEVLVMDNLSTDSTIEVIRKNYYFDKRIRVYSEKDDGIYDAMNKGISLANGDWIYFMGADDRLANPEVLVKVVAYLNEYNDIVYGDVNWMPENIIESGIWKYETLINQNINHQRIFYRKSLFDQYGDFHTIYKIASDYELNIRFFCNKSICKKYVPINIANYHSGGFSSGKTDEVFWEDWDKIVYERFLPYLSKKAIYSNLAIYCRYHLRKRNYKQALRVIIKVFVNTYSFGFVKLMVVYLFKKQKNLCRLISLL